jgi:EAL domain-containing protein (putative c-di-GMP-specific phosphodiesterase class I)
MANNLGLDIIAEGVETKEQQQLLFEYGCFNYQGYLFGKPIPIDKFEAQIKQSWLKRTV